MKNLLLLVMLFCLGSTNVLSADKVDALALLKQSGVIFCPKPASGTRQGIGDPECVAETLTVDLDGDGSDELAVLHQKMQPGWEGEPFAVLRFTLFVTENNQLHPLYTTDYDHPVQDNLAIITDGTKTNLFVEAYGKPHEEDGWNWFLLQKHGAELTVLLRPAALREQALKENHFEPEKPVPHVAVRDNRIVETFSEKMAQRHEAEIVYGLHQDILQFLSFSKWTTFTKNVAEFRFPAKWGCTHTDANGSPGEFDVGKPSSGACEEDIGNAHMFTYHMYPTASRNEKDALILVNADTSDPGCTKWLAASHHPIQGCISKWGGNYFAVYSDSELPALRESYKQFMKINDFTPDYMR